MSVQSFINTTVTVNNEATGAHCHNESPYHYHGKRKLPQCVVECTDYTADSPNSCATIA
jgi:hypothetical protein